MENQNSIQKTILTYGVVLGVLSIVFALLNYSFGNIYKPHWIFSLLSFALLIGVIVYALKTYKTANNGFLSMGQAIKIGVGIALISAIIGVVYQYIFTHVIEPDFYTKMVDFQQQMMLEKFPDMPEEQIEKTVEMTKKFSNPIFSSSMAIGISLLFGLIISAIAGAVMKKEETQY